MRILKINPTFEGRTLAMTKTVYSIVAIALLLLVLSSCGVNSNLMFRTGKEFKGYDSIPMSPRHEYRISPNDRIDLRVYTNNGSKIFDFMTGANSESGGAMRTANMSMDYLVRQDGYAELPVIGNTKLDGLTILEAQEALKTLYTQYINDPFVQIRVVNQRVIVFPGGGSDAVVVTLENANTTLMEALARAGGIAERGRAKHVKVMRQTPKGREVYLIDLSTLDGLLYADMVVQANDYIYVEPVRQITREVMQEVAPIVSIVTSAFVVVTLILTFK
jgi:polysaccharide biosynthesis/export protein